MNWGQLNKRNRELQLSFSWRKQLPGGSQEPDTRSCYPNLGESSSPSAATAHPWEICSSSLENRAVFLNVFFSGFLGATHLLFGYYWVEITFLLPHLLHGPEATRHRVQHACKFGFFYPRTQCPCAAEVKHGVILPASKDVCMYWGMYL